MRAIATRLWLVATLIAATPVVAQTSAPSIAQALPNCGNSSLTRPIDQTVISLQDAYPPLSTLLDEEGNTDVAFTVNANGTVRDVVLVQSSGSLRLDAAAISAAKQLIYTPAKSGTTPVACRNQMRIVWRIDALKGQQSRAAEWGVFLAPGRDAWPPGALARGKEGATTLAITLSPAGRVRETKIARSSGADDLDEAAAAFVLGRKFGAAQVDGKAVNTVLEVVVIWSLQPVKNLPVPTP
jgi:TonB family protein